MTAADVDDGARVLVSWMVDDGVMECVSSDVLEDPAYSVPSAPAAPRGVGWLRGEVPRFSDGDAHRRRRALVVRVIDRLGLVSYAGTPTRSLLAALGLPPDLEADVGLVAAACETLTSVEGHTVAQVSSSPDISPTRRWADGDCPFG